ncbi:MAG: 4Fe-4S dicluster domain-containing protein [Magnetococcales bacterium]|nr:4Fe-4S dicluster domain-containing protein [Magnetococcales bacterium]
MTSTVPDVSRETLFYDAVVVGAGPAGLSAAIFLAREWQARVCVLEKAARVGGHSLSGALLEPDALASLFPDGPPSDRPPPPTGIPVTGESLWWLTAARSWSLPVPRVWNQAGCRILSLGRLVRWLGEVAEGVGVDLLPGFPAVEPLWDGPRLAGVVTGDLGRGQDGAPRDDYQPGVAVRAPVTILAEGCRGYLSRRIIRRLELDQGCAPQTHVLGLKEVWRVPEAGAGGVIHTLGWPLPPGVHGGGFLYRGPGNRVSVGLVAGLDYANPAFDPFGAFQQWKTHPRIRVFLDGGEPVGYGARTLPVGGWQSLPEMAFPGGLLIGDGAGLLDAARLKGIGNAIASGVLAARWVGEQTSGSLRERWRREPGGRRLWDVRNVRPGFRRGTVLGLGNAVWEAALGGRSPWTWTWSRSDRQRLLPMERCRGLTCPAPDGRLAFDRATALSRSGLHHEPDQPVHLLRDRWVVPDPFDHPETRYCPAGVFQRGPGDPPVRVHPGNCLHCKSCDIKDPHGALRWIPPEGGSGPDYPDL